VYFCISVYNKTVESKKSVKVYKAVVGMFAGFRTTGPIETKLKQAKG
jgi:hypothetical protein